MIPPARAAPAPGFTVWLTGLPAAGKTTLATALADRLARRRVPVVLLDGDVLRRGASRDLGYDSASRAENARRAAAAAAAAALAGKVALVALVSPYECDRRAARDLHAGHGLSFVEVYLATPLAECERRDPKQLYARGRRGELRHLTGLDDPYELPGDPELVLGRGCESVAADVAAVLDLLLAQGLLPAVDGALP